MILMIMKIMNKMKIMKMIMWNNDNEIILMKIMMK